MVYAYLAPHLLGVSYSSDYLREVGGGQVSLPSSVARGTLLSKSWLPTVLGDGDLAPSRSLFCRLVSVF